MICNYLEISLKRLNRFNSFIETYQNKQHFHLNKKSDYFHKFVLKRDHKNELINKNGTNINFVILFSYLSYLC